MNKVILSALVLLIVAQGIESQLSITYSVAGSAVVNFVDSVAFNFTSVAYDNLNMFGFTFRFQPAVPYTSYVSPPNTIAVDPLSLNTMTNTLGLIATHMKNIDTATSASYTTLNSFTLSQRSSSVASLAISQQREAFTRVGYLTHALATIFGGVKPNAPTFDTSVPPFTYPPLSTALPVNDNPLGAFTLGQQATAFGAYVTSLIAHVQEFNRQFGSLKRQVPGRCACPDATDVARTNVLNSLYATITSFSKSQANTTLVQFVGSSVHESIAAGFFNAYLSQLDMCVKCVLTNLGKSGARSIKLYYNGKPSIDSTSVGVNDTSFIGHGLRAIARVTSNARRDILYAASRSKVAQSFLLQRVSSSITEILSKSELALWILQLNTNFVRSTTFKNSLGQLYATLNNFYLGYKTSITAIAANVTAKIAQLNSIVTATAVNASNVVTAAVVNISQTVVNASELYPCCLRQANYSLDVQAKFANDLKMCGQAYDTAVSTSNLQVINNVQAYGMALNDFFKETDACINFLRGFYKLMYFLLMHNDSENKTKCVNAVSAKITAGTATIYASGNATLTAATSNLPLATETYQTCVNNAVASAHFALANIDGEFQACKRALSCDYRPSLVPNITALQSNLTALLTLSLAELECVQAVIKNANVLTAKLAQLSSTLYENTFNKEASLLASITASVDKINFEFATCNVHNRAILQKNITNAAS